MSSLITNHDVSADSHCIVFSNAFNFVDRECMFQEAHACIPSISAWLECSYQHQSSLHFGDQTILSCCGVQQGDPLDPLGFALALQPVIEQISREVPGLLINAWFLDNGTLCGSPSDLCAALSIIEAEGPSRGLFLNHNKSQLVVPPNATPSVDSLPQGIPISEEGFTLLGSPIGSASFCSSTIFKCVSKIEGLLERLRDIQDSQMETTLLRSWLSLPKISFSLHTCAPSLILPALSAFDNIIRRALSDLAGSPLSDWAWLKASLPSSLGELNLRWALSHAPAAFISSYANSRDLIELIIEHPPAISPSLPSCISALAEAAARPLWSSIEDIDVPLQQHFLSYEIDRAAFDILLASAPDRHSRTFVLSCSVPHAGEWLNVISSPSLGLHLMDREFRGCLKYWLGLHIFEEGAKCTVWHSTADIFGNHHVGCGGNADRIFHHNSIRDVMFSASQTAALAPRKEAPSLINRACCVTFKHLEP